MVADGAGQTSARRSEGLATLMTSAPSTVVQYGLGPVCYGCHGCFFWGRSFVSVVWANLWSL